jgi:predicted transcriptional regulator YdeE
MQPKLVEHPAFHVVGLSTRTSNADEMAGKGRIGAIWERFYAESLLQKIPHQTEPGVVLALYTEYEEDVNAPYSFAVGVKVDDVAELPPGLTAYSVPATKYALFTSGGGSIPGIVIDVWKAIWSSQIKRAYCSDFEIYDGRSLDRNNAQIDVWVSVR